MQLKDSTLVTVGIPTYNRADWLRESIRSVLSQDLADFRLVISDNASTDDTSEVVRSFGDDRVEYVRARRNVGRIGNVNRLIDLAQTKYLVLLPDDDILYPDHLSSTVALLERSATTGLVHSAFDLIDADSRRFQRMNPLAPRPRVRIEKGDDLLDRLMVDQWPMCFSSVTYRTAAIVGAGGFREEEEPASDFQLWLRIALDWDFGYVAQPLAGFREHPGAASQKLEEADADVAPSAQQVGLGHAQIRFRRRMEFLDSAHLEPTTKTRLRGLATLALVTERIGYDLPKRALAPALAALLRTDPGTLFRPALRNLFAQLGVRWLRSLQAP